jgi:hypothetical protein
VPPWELIGRSRFNRLTRRPALYWRAWRKSLDLQQDVTELTRRLEATLAGGNVAARSELLVPLFVDRALGGISEAWLPDGWWALAGELGWREPIVAIDHACTLRDTLRRRVLVDLGELPVPMLAPQTHWTLIALANGGVRHRGQSSARRLLRGVQRLQVIAAKQVVAQAAWAGFWDQWLLLEAIELWSGALQRVDKNLAAALRRLPLADEMQRRGFVTMDSAANDAGPQLAAPRWEAEMPDWFWWLCKWDRERRATEAHA